MLTNYRRQKQQTMSALARLAELAGNLGMMSLKADIEQTRMPKLDSEGFNLVVLGEFNHGKTTFVNALLGKPLLPVGITPTTATINHIVWADSPWARAVFLDGAHTDVDPEHLPDYVTLEGAHAAKIRHVELGYPAPLLKHRVTLVDTPGVNDINEARAEITYSYVPRADAVIFLLDGTQVLKQSERAFIQQRLLRRSRDKLLFVVGKVDLLDEQERQQALAFAAEHLAQLVAEPTIFALSARAYLQGAGDESGIAALLEHLGNMLSEQRGRILLDNAIADALRTAGYLQSSMAMKREGMKLSLEELAARIEQLRRQLLGSRASLSKLEQRISAESAAIKATLRHDLRHFVEAFCRIVPGQIDKADAADVKRYLQFFIQDKFKEWAELEGEKLAELLEGLATEIIRVTNQNVGEVLAAVSECLGETRVDMDVDTLKYDAGIFALGALGTTVMLFVNAFVGGLLTLAAPILAVALREKLAATVKIRAKEQAPQAIKRAGEAVRPRFEAVVDDFARRLSDFVNEAGDSLNRGISELLDRTLAERSQGHAEEQAMSEKLVAHVTELTRLQQELEALRGTLWVQ